MRTILTSLCFLFAAQLLVAEEAPWYNPASPALHGTVVDESGTPLANIRVFETWTGEQRSVNTDANGNFTFPRGDRTDRLVAENVDRSLLGIWEETQWRTGQPNTDTTIVLKPARTITGTVKDAAGEPIADAQVITTVYYSEVVQTQSNASGEFRFQYPVDVPLEAIVALKNGVGFDYIWTLETPSDEERHTHGREGNPAARKKSDGPFALVLDGVKPVRFQCLDDAGQPLEGVQVRPWYFTKPEQPNDLNIALSHYRIDTAADGNVVFDFFPNWQTQGVTFRMSKDGFLDQRLHLTPEDFGKVNTVRMRWAITVRGTVSLPDGTPATRWTVNARGGGDFQTRNMTDEQGRYEIMAPRNQNIHIVANRPTETAAQSIEKEWIAAPKLNVATGDDGILVQDFTLEKGTRISGRATISPGNEPATNASIYIHCLQTAEDANSVLHTFWDTTQADGTYEFYLAPGHYQLQLWHENTNSPHSFLTVEKDVEQRVDFQAARRAVATVRTIRGKAVFVDDPNLPIAGATVSTRADDDRGRGTTTEADENGDFEIQVQNAPVYVQVMSPDGNFGRMVIVEPTETEFLVSLEPTASVFGKIIDRNSETPPAGWSITYAIHMEGEQGTWQNVFQRETKTNENGEYEIRNIPTGVGCHIMLPIFDYGEEESSGSSWIARDLNLRPGQDRQLIDFTFTTRPNWSSEYLLQVHNVYGRMWNSQNAIEQRFETLLARAQRDGKSGVFAILVRDEISRDPQQNDFRTISDIYEVLFDDDDVFAQTERFYTMCIMMYPEERRNVTSGMARGFVNDHKIALPLPSLFSFAIFDAEGKLQGVEAFDYTLPKPQQRQRLIEMLAGY